MKNQQTYKVWACMAAVIMLLCNSAIHAQAPVLFLTDASKAATVKKNIKSSKYAEANLAALVKQSNKWMQKKMGSVMEKKFTPPCGNMHEYMSMARYYWPDPTKPDGKPYIRKDGEKNPANDLITDDKYFDDLIDAVYDLSWTYYFTDEEQYASRATELIEMWFLDTATRMLPNLNHAQIKSGIDTGAATGIIDSHNLPKVCDAIGLLRSSKSWKKIDEYGMKLWFAEYLKWMMNSKNGKKESEAKNNHGTFYEMQVSTIALFCGENEIAQQTFKKGFARLAWQIEPDGKQPLELERTAALGYSTFNLEAWCMFASTASTKGVDYWNYATTDGRSLKKAIDYLVPYVIDGKAWEYKQINPYKTQDFYHLLVVAADKLKDDSYKKLAEKIKDKNKEVLFKLFYE